MMKAYSIKFRMTHWPRGKSTEWIRYYDDIGLARQNGRQALWLEYGNRATLLSITEVSA